MSYAVGCLANRWGCNHCALSAPKAKIKLVVLMALKTNMHVNMLARAKYGRLDGTLLLLTWLGVRACPAPHTVHLCRPPLQQKPWRELNCS